MYSIETIKIGILAIVQGITELLPISSSGHLILLGEYFDIPITTLILSIFHLGTTFAIILFFRKELFKNLFTKEKLLFYSKILVASIPTGIVGFLFEKLISKRLRATWIIAVSLIVWGIVMILMEQKKKYINKEKIENVSWKQAISIGLSQTLALIPGTSRSGITTITGMLVGLDKYTALKYSFILGIPVLLGSSIYGIFKEFGGMKSLTMTTLSVSTIKMIVVAILPFIVGYISLILLKKFQKKNWLTYFGIYRILLGILTLILL